MKLALIAVTARGAKLAKQVMDCFAPTAEIYVKTGRNSIQAIHEFESLSAIIENLFNKYDGLIFIMATGIVVRVIAPYIQDKRYDPAIIVMDETGQHTISLLSGHLGGANDLARDIAEAIGADPVITTATDVNHKPAVDLLAKKLGLIIEPFAQLKQANAAIVNHDQVVFYVDESLTQAAQYQMLARQCKVLLQPLQKRSDDKTDFAVILTDQQLPNCKSCLYLRPPTLFLGIGCRRGTAAEDLAEAIADACRRIGHSMLSIAGIGSSVVKNDEPGLLAIAKQLSVPLVFFTNDQLQKSINEYQLTTSNFVKQQIGVGNVCEASALSMSQQKLKLLLPRTKYKHITIAIAKVNFP